MVIHVIISCNFVK